MHTHALVYECRVIPKHVCVSILSTHFYFHARNHTQHVCTQSHIQSHTHRHSHTHKSTHLPPLLTQRQCSGTTHKFPCTLPHMPRPRCACTHTHTLTPSHTDTREHPHIHIQMLGLTCLQTPPPLQAAFCLKFSKIPPWQFPSPFTCLRPLPTC